MAHLRQPIRGTQPLRVRFRSARYARLRSTSPAGVGWQQPESNLQKGSYTGEHSIRTVPARIERNAATRLIKRPITDKSSGDLAAYTRDAAQQQYSESNDPIPMDSRHTICLETPLPPPTVEAG